MKEKNCLNLIRILAAIQVFLGHASEHLNISLPGLLMKPFSIIQGVPVFFLISGFLIWNSLNHNSAFKQFAKSEYSVSTQSFGGDCPKTKMNVHRN